MKIHDAKQAYSAQLNTLWDKKRALSQLLKEPDGGASGLQAFDRVEISRQLSEVDAQYAATQGVMEAITAKETMIQNTESAKQQGEAMAKAAKEMGKMMEVYRRIASGGKVPPEDEKKLMEYNHELYMAAKTAALLAKRNEEEYDSLWEDEEENSSGETADPSEIAGETEISVSVPETVAADAAAEMA